MTVGTESEEGAYAEVVGVATDPVALLGLACGVARELLVLAAPLSEVGLVESGEDGVVLQLPIAGRVRREVDVRLVLDERVVPPASGDRVCASATRLPCTQNEGLHALVDHQRADLDELARDRAVLDQRVLLVEVRDELGAVMPPVALRREDELARLVPRELLALEQDLEGGPDGRRGRECAVHVDRPEGEAGADGLVDVDN